MMVGWAGLGWAGLGWLPELACGCGCGGVGVDGGGWGVLGVARALVLALL